MIDGQLPQKEDHEVIKQRIISDFGLVFIETEPPLLPELDFSDVSNEEARSSLSLIASMLKDFSDLPFIADKFGPDSEAREKFRKTLSKDAFAIYANELGGLKNKLVGGQRARFSPTISLVNSLVSSKKELSSIPPDKLKSLIQWKEDTILAKGVDYNKMDNMERIKFIKELEEWILRFFEIFQKSNS